MIKIYTIGVYGSTEKSFFQKLVDNEIDFFCDIRQRRGVRGANYKYVNSNYLQAKLSKLGISYIYLKDLAPTNEIREMQKEADKLNNETKKQRTTLGSVFAREYKRLILDNFDMSDFVHVLEEKNVRNVVFFCVEEKAAACHRSLVAEKLAGVLNTQIINL